MRRTNETNERDCNRRTSIHEQLGHLCRGSNFFNNTSLFLFLISTDIPTLQLFQNIGHMKMLLDGGADLVVAQPIHVLGVWGMLSQDILLFICSEINSGAF